MLARVRRSDLALTGIAVAGLSAGTVLTIGKTLGLTGPVLIGAGIVAGVTVLVQGVRGQVTSVLDLEAAQHQRLAAVLDGPIRPVAEADPFTIGVFRSELAERAQRDPLAQAGHAMPPYVPRGVDAPLHRALEGPSLAAAGRLVVLRGDPKSGKSRSLWEAVRTLPGRDLLAVRPPDPAVTQPGDPAFAPLATLVGLDRPVSGPKGSGLVIWVDDAHNHLLERGLNGSTLRRLAELYPRAVIAMTIHAHILDGLQRIDRDLHGLLREPFDDLVVEPWLAGRELECARDAYPALAGDPGLARLPEMFAGANLLIDKYRHHRADEPAGVAAAKAAVDWQRAGMPPGSIDEPCLMALAAIALADIAPNREMDDQAFARGLAWACEEVAAFAALVCREPARARHARRFRAFDAVVWWAHRHEAPVSPQTWDFVVTHAAGADLISVGIAAYLAEEWEAALGAFRRAAGSASPPVAAGGLIGAGLTLGQLARHEEELAAFRQVAERFGAGNDQALAPYVAAALAHEGARLRQLGRLDEPAARERADRPGVPGAGAPPGQDGQIVQLIYLLTEEFYLLHLPSDVEAFRARWPALAGLPPEQLAWLRRRTAGPPGLGFGRPGEVDGIVSVVAWFVVAGRGSRSPRSRVRRARARVRRVAGRRRLRPEAGDALARFLAASLGDEALDRPVAG